MSDTITKPKSKAGRPSSFTEETADAILELISRGVPLNAVCKREGMPHPTTVRDWMKANQEFADAMAIARETGYDQIAMEILAIADDTSNDTIMTPNGTMPNKEWILRSKLRVDARFKLLAKWDPKRYGDRIAQEISGPDGKPIEVSHSISSDVVTAFSVKLYAAFTSYQEDNGETATLTEQSMASLSEVVARFASGEEIAHGRSPDEIGSKFAKFAIMTAKIKAPASFQGIERDLE